MEVKNKFNTVKIATCNDAHKAEAISQLFERSLLFNRSDDICGIVISKNDEKQFIPISAIPDNVNIEKREGVVTLVENPVVDSITTKADHNGVDWKSQYKIAETSAERTIILLCTKNIENTANIGVIGGEILEVGEGIYGHYKISLTPAGSGFLKGATTFEQKAALVSAKYNGTYYYGIKFKSTVPASIYFAGWGHFPDAASAPSYTSYNDADLSEIIELGDASGGGMTEAEKAEISAIINTNKNDIAALKTSVAGKADTGHTHDDRYYTESEVDKKLAGKSNVEHTHTKSEITDFAHTHDDRYFTETEITNKLAEKSDTSHKHSADDITSGVLPIVRGGTGATTAKGAQKALLSDMQTETTAIVDSTEFVMKYRTPTDTKGALFKRSATLVWNYIKGKISSVLGLTASNYGGKANTAGTADKTVNDITIDIPVSNSNYEFTDKYVILLGKIPEPTSTSSSSYSWDACGSISVLGSSIHNIAHIHFSAGHGHSHSNKTYIDFDSANYSTSSSIKCFKYNSVWWLGIQIELPAGQYVGNAHITYKRNVPEEFLTAILYCSSSDFAQAVSNNEINSSIQDVKPWWPVTRTWQNYIQAPSFIGNLNGNASTATNATNDGNGNVITSTYATKTELAGKSDTGHTHTSVIDNGNKSTATTFAYSKSGLDTTDWFAAWNGYELRAISPAKTLSTIGAAASSHTHTKSQITDFPTSLPANGGTADKATRDGNGNIIVSTYMPISGGTFTGKISTQTAGIRIPTSQPSSLEDGDIWIQ